MYIIANKYDYEAFFIIGACKSLENAKKVIKNLIKSDRKKYENEAYKITTKQCKDPDYVYAINIYRDKKHDIKDGFNDHIWYGTYYVEKLDILD